MATHSTQYRQEISRIGGTIIVASTDTDMHREVSWMVAADDAVLQLLNQVNIQLTPSVIAHNLGYNRDYIATRCRELAERGLLRREEDGGPFYGLTSLGMRYNARELDPSELE